MNVKEITKRLFRENYNGKTIVMSTKSMLTGHDESYGLCKWSNCLYISIIKEDFPLLKFPKWILKDPEISWDKDKFDYFRCDLAELNWHWGITFYEEKIIEGKTIVTAGCDYQHLHDERVYGIEDCGKHILLSHGKEIVEQFIHKYISLEVMNTGVLK